MNKKKSKEIRIVVVDDSEYSRLGIAEVLESHGHNVVGQAASAEEGINIGATTGANLFIIDVIMPERSGLEMAKVLSEKSMGSRVIMISSLNLESIIIESISSGALDFLPKPFTPEQLIDAVEKIAAEMEND